MRTKPGPKSDHNKIAINTEYKDSNRKNQRARNQPCPSDLYGLINGVDSISRYNTI